MVFFITLITLFVIGSVAGWIIEVLFRRFFSQHKWINPGFLIGPYIPLYGFGVVILYLLSNIKLDLINNVYLEVILKILIIAICITLIEFVAGLIFIKGLKIKLWDYSNQKGNILGIICPLFSFFWLIISSLYYFFINPYLCQAIEWLASQEHNIYYFFIGIIYGMMITDFAYSMHIATHIRKAAKELKITVNLDKFRENVRTKTQEFYETKIKDYKKPFFFPFKNNHQTMLERLKDYKEKLINKNNDSK